MNQKELDDLIDTLLKSGLVNNKNEAKKMATSMIETSDKVQKEANEKQKESTYNPRMQEKLTEENLNLNQNLNSEADEEAVVPLAEDKKLNDSTWTENTSNKIISNNEIMKTLETIGRQPPKDPNENLTNTEKVVNRYEKIENLYKEKKESGDWLPANPRSNIKYTGNINPTENFGGNNIVENKQEPLNEKPEQEIKEPIREEDVSNNTSNNYPNNNYSKPSENKISPEEYTAMRMSGSLSDLIKQQEVEEKPIETHTQNDDVESLFAQDVEDIKPVVEEKDTSVISNQPHEDINEVREKILEQEVQQNHYQQPKEEQVQQPIVEKPVENNNADLFQEEKPMQYQQPEEKKENLDVTVTESEPEENNSEFLQVKDDIVAPEKPEEEKKEEEKKKGRWTEDELKLKDQIDLSKVFNFGNRG